MSQTPALSQEDLAYKKFKKRFRGYDEEEVDIFLTQIMRDYAYFNTHFTNMANELNILRSNAPKSVKFDDLDNELQQIIKNSDRLYKQVKKHSKN